MSSDILIKVGADITGFSKSMAEASKSLKGFAKENQETSDAFKDVGGVITGAGIAIAGGLGIAVKQASDWQSAFAGVRKTVNMSEAEFAVLEKGIRDMAKELPASAEEIAGVAEQAGQLGISKENILDFSRTMIDLGEATNLTADEAATSFARFANITKMPQDAFGKLGSVVVDLGNNMATTEAEIVDMSMRLAAQGKQVGMSESEIMALAASMSSLGIESEAGGSAMTMVLTKMQKAVMDGGEDLDKFAQAAGMTAQDFADSFKNDPVKALEQLSSGLGDSAEAGGNMSAILEELGITGIREADVMKRLAGNSELLGEAVGIANGAWGENSALTDEAAQRYETFESKLAIFGNSIKDVGIMVGDVLLPFVTDLVEKMTDLFKWISNLSPELVTIGTVFAAVAGAIALVAGPILLLIGFLPQIFLGFAKLKVVFAAVSAAIGAISWPIVLVVAAVIGLAVLIYKYWDEIKEYTIKAWGAIADFFTELWATIVELATTAWSALVDGVMAVVNPFIEMVVSTFDAMREGLSQIMDGLKTFFEGVWELIKNVFLGAVLLIVNLVTGDFEELKKNAKAIFENIKKALTDIWNGIKTMFSGVLSAIKGFFSSAWDNLKTITTNMFNSMKTTVTNKMTEVKNKISEIWDGVMSFFRNIDLRQIGKDVIQGLINGIKDKVEAVGRAIKEVTGAITGKIKSILGIKSPSRVLAQIGRWTGEGLAIGIAAETGNVEKAAQGLADAAIIEPTMSYKTPNANYGSLSAALSGEVNVNQRESMLVGAIESLERKLANLVVEMDGQTVGVLVAPTVSETINAEANGTTRGRGRRRI